MACSQGRKYRHVRSICHCPLPQLGSVWKLLSLFYAVVISIVATTVQLLISMLFPLNHNLWLLCLPPAQGGEQFVAFFLVELLN